MTISKLTEMSIYFDDIRTGQQFILGPYKIKRKELLDFNKYWDPLPIHTCDEAARRKCLETRRSKSKKDRGIIKFDFRLINQEDKAVLTYLDTVMFSRAPEQS